MTLRAFGFEAIERSEIASKLKAHNVITRLHNDCELLVLKLSKEARLPHNRKLTMSSCRLCNDCELLVLRLYTSKEVRLPHNRKLTMPSCRLCDDFVSFWLWGYRSDIRTNFQAPVILFCLQWEISPSTSNRVKTRRIWVLTSRDK